MITIDGAAFKAAFTKVQSGIEGEMKASLATIADLLGGVFRDNSMITKLTNQYAKAEQEYNKKVVENYKIHVNNLKAATQLEALMEDFKVAEIEEVKRANTMVIDEAELNNLY